MAGVEHLPKSKFGYVIAVVTTAVAIISLYYTYVQTEIARKTLEMSWSDRSREQQKAVADLGKQIAAKTADKDLSGPTRKLAELYEDVADNQPDRERVRIQKTVAAIQKEVVALRQEKVKLQRQHDDRVKELDAKAKLLAARDVEITALRSQLALAKSGPAMTLPKLLSLTDMDTLLNKFHKKHRWNTSLFAKPDPLTKPKAGWSLPFDKYKVGSDTWKGLRLTTDVKLPSSKPQPSLLGELWEVIKKHWIASIFWGIVIIILIAKARS